MADSEKLAQSPYNMSRVVLMVVSASIAAVVLGYENGIACGTLLYIDRVYPGITLAEKSVSSLYLS